MFLVGIWCCKKQILSTHQVDWEEDDLKNEDALKNEEDLENEENFKNEGNLKNTAKRNMSSAVCASSMYSRRMKMSSFLSVRAWAMPHT